MSTGCPVFVIRDAACSVIDDLSVIAFNEAGVALSRNLISLLPNQHSIQSGGPFPHLTMGKHESKHDDYNVGFSGAHGIRAVIRLILRCSRTVCNGISRSVRQHLLSARCPKRPSR